MMAIIIESFPCTKDLEPYVRSYLNETAKLIDSSRVSVYAAYCLRRYDACWKNNSNVRIPTKEEIEKIQQDPFSGAMFGGSLEDIMIQQRKDYPNVNIPRVMAIMCDCIIESGGENTEGIFRIASNMDKVYQQKVLLEKGVSQLEKNRDPHVPACLLKTWLQELQDPVIPNDYYDLIIKNDGDIKALSYSIEKLPDVNRNSLYYLIRFLRRIGNPENQVC